MDPAGVFLSTQDYARHSQDMPFPSERDEYVLKDKEMFSMIDGFHNERDSIL